MRVYKVELPKSISPVGVVVEHGKVTAVHPSIGVKRGASVEKVKEVVKKKKGRMVKVLPMKGYKKKRRK